MSNLEKRENNVENKQYNLELVGAMFDVDPKEMYSSVTCPEVSKRSPQAERCYIRWSNSSNSLSKRQTLV